MRSVIIIPTLNPNSKIIDLVKALKEEGFNMFVIVDDGSKKECTEIFSNLESLGCKIAHHMVNEGKGKAIKTGIDAAVNNFQNFIGFITVDGDYQHLPKDVKKIAEKIEEHNDKIILGERSFKDTKVPIKSRIGNSFSTMFFKLQNGVYIKDTQTGLRGIPVKFKDFAMQVEGNRYEYEMNFLREAVANKIEFEMIDIETVYDDNNVGTHFRPLKDAYLIYKEPIRFAFIAIMSSVIDILLFTILHNVFSALLLTVINLNMISGISNVIARLVSGLFNFTMNKKFAFESKGNTKKQFIQYTSLFIAVLCTSTILVSLASNLPINITISKIIIDFIIFFTNYFVEKRVIFKAEKKTVK